MSNLITLSTAKEMGFTPSLITVLLPEPTLKPNPHYRSASPMKLWERETVEAAMLTPEFIAASAKREKRKAAAQKAVKTKQQNIISEFEGRAAEITVEVMPMDNLRRQALEDRQAWYDSQWSDHGWEHYDFPQDAYSADDETVIRWMVNYIRHNLTHYDFELYGLDGKVGKGEAYKRYKGIVLDKIAAAYPDLSDECNRQKLMN